MIKVYSTGCPQCKVLEAKLKEKKIEYEVINGMDEMSELGIMSVPQMDLGDGKLLTFVEAVEWVNKEECEAN